MKRSGSKAANISRERLERAARIYNSSVEAAAALGIAGGTFARICQERGIETPAQRRKRKSRRPSTIRDFASRQDGLS